MAANRPKPPLRIDSLGAIFYKDTNGTEHTYTVPVDDTTMWQDDEDNNPYGSFNQDSTGTTNTVPSASCTIANHMAFSQ